MPCPWRPDIDRQPIGVSSVFEVCEEVGFTGKSHAELCADHRSDSAEDQGARCKIPRGVPVGGVPILRSPQAYDEGGDDGQCRPQEGFQQCLDRDCGFRPASV